MTPTQPPAEPAGQESMGLIETLLAKDQESLADELRRTFAELVDGFRADRGDLVKAKHEWAALSAFDRSAALDVAADHANRWAAQDNVGKPHLHVWLRDRRFAHEPPAVPWTDLELRLARDFDADVRQRGTAPPPMTTILRAVHHFVDGVDEPNPYAIREALHHSWVSTGALMPSTMLVAYNDVVESTRAVAGALAALPATTDGDPAHGPVAVTTTAATPADVLDLITGLLGRWQRGQRVMTEALLSDWGRVIFAEAERLGATVETLSDAKNHLLRTHRFPPECADICAALDAVVKPTDDVLRNRAVVAMRRLAVLDGASGPPLEGLWARLVGRDLLGVENPDHHWIEWLNQIEPPVDPNHPQYERHQRVFVSLDPAKWQGRVS